MLHIHAVDGESLGDGVDGVPDERGPGGKQMCKGRRALEVCGEGECCERNKNSLNILLVSLCAPHGIYMRPRWGRRGLGTIVIQT